MSKSKQATRAEQVAVSDDAGGAGWLTEGAWVAIVCADPIYHGRLVAVTPTHYFLAEASWVPDTGRAHDFAANPQTRSESEYLGAVAVERPVVAIYRVRTNGPLETK